MTEQHKDIVEEGDAVIERLLHELENEQLAAGYAAASVAIDQYFATTGKPRPEDIQF